MSCEHRWEYRKQDVGVDLETRAGKYKDTLYLDIEFYYCKECGELQNDVAEYVAQRDTEWLAAVDEMSKQVDNTYPKGNAFGAVLRSFINELKTRMEAKG